jgi:hypothetical protein
MLSKLPGTNRVQILLVVCCFLVLAVLLPGYQLRSAAFEGKDSRLDVDIDNDGTLESVSFSDNILSISQLVQEGKKDIVFIEKISSIGASDLDNDGMIDLKVNFVTGESETLYYQKHLHPIYQMKTDNVYFYESFYTGSGNLTKTYDAAVGDFDQDMAKDFVATTWDPYKAMVVYENNGNNSFQEVFRTPLSEAPPGIYSSVAAADTDGDGHCELIAGEVSTLGQVFLYEHEGDNQYVKREIGISEPDFTGGYQIKKVMVADTDGDGKKEIIFIKNPSSFGGKLFIYEHTGVQGENVYQKVYQYNVSSYLVNFNIGDSDNDGLQEIILGQGGFGNTEPYIRRLELNPISHSTNNNNYIDKVVSANTGMNGLLLSPYVADTDLDGNNELIFGGTSSSGGTIYIFESPSNDQFDLKYYDGGINGNIITTAVSKLNYVGYPVVISGSFEGQVDMWSFTSPFLDPPYQKILTPPIVIDQIRSIDVAFMDQDRRYDLVLAIPYATAVAGVHIYEQYSIASQPILND